MNEVQIVNRLIELTENDVLLWNDPGSVYETELHGLRIQLMWWYDSSGSAPGEPFAGITLRVTGTRALATEDYRKEYIVYAHNGGSSAEDAHADPNDLYGRLCALECAVPVAIRRRQSKGSIEVQQQLIALLHGDTL